MVKDSGTPPPPPPSSSDEESIMLRPSSAGGEESGGDLRPPLPVMALREKIVAKIQENRVTLIVGDTGCGKSSQVPQFLLEENVEPILCTQPRRFAVVAIARMVAKARNCDIGGDVGYHIGHSNVSNIGSRSRIVFKTAGVVLEQIRDKGLDALTYKVIILDEVHERSVESDLLLTCVKQFMMKKNDLRLVLMSATADITRYRDYFKDLGRGERVEVIAIPSAPRHVIFERKVLYLDQVADLLGMDTESLSNRYCPYSDADMRPETHSLIFKLVLHLHENEPNIEKSILVFLPTYCSLEQLWILLKPHSRFFKVHILHSSIDIDQALLAMSVCNSHRKVILATNIAESSVTIPGVAYVVDSCRSLQVFWDCNRKVDSSELVWVSKSQADQRRGRTGRTCDGKIYRLVTRSFYTSLDDYEYPAILRLSLRQQVLMICCSESKAINDPKVLLQRVLDPPDPERVEDALGFLVQIKALKKSPYRGRYEVTFYGRLLDSLPLSFDASVLTLKLGEIGLLHEGIVIGILMDVQPLPILQPFGHQILFQQFVDNYFRSFNSSAFLMGKKVIIFMGNLCAFQFWQRIFKDKIRLEWLKQVANGDEPKVPQTIVTKLEEEWCFSHNLLQTSLHNVSEIYEDIMEIIHCFRPSFMEKVDFPCYLEPYTFDHECLFRSELETNSDALLLEEENIDSASLRRTCLSVPYVLSDDFQVNSVAESLKALIKEIRVQYSQKTSIDHGAAMNYATLLLQESPICRFFANGSCNKGDQCTFSHSLQAKKPTCKFFFTLQGCRNGDACLFSHNNEPHLASFAVSSHSLKEDANPIAYNFLQLLPASADSCVVVMDEKNLIFSTKLSQHYDPSKIIATTPRTCSQSGSSSTGFTIIWNVAHPCHKIIEDNYFLPWRQVKCILWFADIEVNDFSGDHPFLQNLFESLAIRMFAESLYDVKVILAMNNIKFSQLQVERLARESFFYLTKSFPFDESTFGKIERMNGSPRPKQSNAPILYVFSMVPPTGIQFGDYSSVFRRALYHHHAQRFLFHSKTISSAGRMLAGVSVMTN